MEQTCGIKIKVTFKIEFRAVFVNNASLIYLSSIACNKRPLAQFTKLFHNFWQNLPADAESYIWSKNRIIREANFDADSSVTKSQMLSGGFTCQKYVDLNKWTKTYC